MESNKLSIMTGGGAIRTFFIIILLIAILAYIVGLVLGSFVTYNMKPWNWGERLFENNDNRLYFAIASAILLSASSVYIIFYTLISGAMVAAPHIQDLYRQRMIDAQMLPQ